jgi:hypothetical protein
MKNDLIKYKLSTDYNRLYKMLKDGNILIGFIAIDVNGVPNLEYSKLTTLSYNSEFKSFDLGFVFFELDFNKIDFDELCKKQNVRFIDLTECKHINQTQHFSDTFGHYHTCLDCGRTL